MKLTIEETFWVKEEEGMHRAVDVSFTLNCHDAKLAKAAERHMRAGLKQLSKVLHEAAAKS